MQLILSSRNFDMTPDVRAYVEEKLARAEKYFGNVIILRVELEFEDKRDDGKDFSCEILVSLPGRKIRVDRQRGQELFEAIDLAEAAMSAQIKGLKEKIIDEARQSKEHLRQMESQPPVDTEGEYEYTYEVEQEPMSLDEAKEQMNLLQQDFYVFTNNETGRTNTVYKKSDGRYGVIVEKK
ncbi:MAG: ribosome-associated translation inhibitor RaiA [Patescibacteria group bacterium]